LEVKSCWAETDLTSSNLGNNEATSIELESANRENGVNILRVGLEGRVMRVE